MRDGCEKQYIVRAWPSMPTHGMDHASSSLFPLSGGASRHHQRKALTPPVATRVSEATTAQRCPAPRPALLCTTTAVAAAFFRARHGAEIDVVHSACVRVRGWVPRVPPRCRVPWVDPLPLSPPLTSLCSCRGASVLPPRARAAAAFPRHGAGRVGRVAYRGDRGCGTLGGCWVPAAGVA